MKKQVREKGTHNKKPVSDFQMKKVGGGQARKWAEDHPEELIATPERYRGVLIHYNESQLDDAADRAERAGRKEAAARFRGAGKE